MDAKTFPSWSCLPIFSFVGLPNLLSQSTPAKTVKGFVQGATGSSVVSQMFDLPLGGSRIHTCGHSFSCNLRILGASDMRTWVRPLILRRLLHLPCQGVRRLYPARLLRSSRHV